MFSQGKRRSKTQRAEEEEEDEEQQEEARRRPAKKSKSSTSRVREPPAHEPRFRVIRDKSGEQAHQQPASSSGSEHVESGVMIPAIPMSSSSSSRLDHDQRRQLGSGERHSGDDAGALHTACLRFIKSDSPSEILRSTFEELHQCIHSAGERIGHGAQFTSFFIDGQIPNLYQWFVDIQTAVIDVLSSPPYSIPVKTLTPTGIVRYHEAWVALHDRDGALYSRILGHLDSVVAKIDDFFKNMAFALFDPVSNCFFVAVHILGKPRSDRTPLLYSTIRFIAQVTTAASPCCDSIAAGDLVLLSSQDLRRLFAAIKSLSDFLHAFASPGALSREVREMVMIPDRDEPFERLLERKSPAFLQEFIQVDPQTSSKQSRIARFETMVRSFFFRAQQS